MNRNKLSVKWMALLLILSLLIVWPTVAAFNIEFIEIQRDPVSGLTGAGFVTVSPDNQFVYAAGFGDNTVVVFNRNQETGALTFAEVQQDGVNDVDGLAGPSEIAISPDGKNAYVASINDNALAVFSRSGLYPSEGTGSDGRLRFIDVEKDGLNGVDGLNGAVSVTVSNDGYHVYAAGFGDDAVAVFSRSNMDGTLSFLELEQDEVNGVDGLDIATSVILSPDDRHLYVTGFGDNAIAVFERQTSTLDPNFGKLTFIEMHQDGLNGVDGLNDAVAAASSPDGAHIYVASRDDNAVAVFSRENDTNSADFGKLTFIEMKQDEVGGVDGLNRANSVQVSADGQHVYVASFDDNAVAVFSRNPTTGELTFVELQQDGVNGVDGLALATWVSVSPDNRHVYAAGQDDDALAVFSREITSGQLTFVEQQTNDSSGLDGLGEAHSVKVSLDGKYVYVASPTDDGIAVFSRDSMSGQLTFVEQQTVGDGNGGTGGDGVYWITLSPDDQHLYAADYHEDRVVAFSRDSTTGKLTLIDQQIDGLNGVDGVSGAYAATVTVDGKHVYVGGARDNAIAVFSRNSSTGLLTFVQKIANSDDPSGVQGIDFVAAIVNSPDGKHIYAGGLGLNGNALALFERNEATGELTFVEATQSGIEKNIRALAMAADGQHLYAADIGGDVVAVFSRDAGTGQLTLVESLKDGENGVSGLAGPHGIQVTPDGQYVYVTSYFSDTLVIFNRNTDSSSPDFGKLTVETFKQDGVDGVDGLDRATSLDFSPDQQNVYVTSELDNSVAVFGIQSSNTDNLNVYLPLVIKQPATSEPEPDDFVSRVIAETNVQRTQNGCPALTENALLNQAAQKHSEDMALNDFFSHTGSNGSQPNDRIAATGYQFSGWAENIARGQSTPEAAVAAWMNSPGHRANILNCDYTEIGVGYYFLENDTGNITGNHYWTQVFGKPVN